MITIYGSKTHKQFKLVSFTPLLLKAYFLSSENYLGTSEKRFFHFHRHFFIRRPRLFCSTNCKLFFNKWAGNQLKIFIFSPKIEVVRISIEKRRLKNNESALRVRQGQLPGVGRVGVLPPSRPALGEDKRQGEALKHA